MAALWELEEAKVDDVRNALPREPRYAYNTIQTVMNRLVERGLLTRRRVNTAYVYRAKLDEAEYLSHSIRSHLGAASTEVRRQALIQLVDGLDPRELEEVRRYAARISKGRRRKADP